MSDVEGTVILLGVLQGAVLAVVLARRHTDRLANRFLAALVGCVALMLLLGYVSERLGFHGYPHLIGLGAVLPFLFGPLLYLYIAALTRPLERFEARFAVHGILFVVNLAFMLQIFYLQPGSEKMRLVAEHLAGGSPLSVKAMGTVEVVQALAYVIASILALRRYSRKIEGYFSDLTDIDLRWLLLMVLAHAAVWTIVLVCHVLMLAGARTPIVQAFDRWTQLASVLVVFLIAYISLWQPELFQKARASQIALDPVPLSSSDSAPTLADSMSPEIVSDAPLPSASAPALDGTATSSAGERAARDAASATAVTAARTPRSTPSEVASTPAPMESAPGRSERLKYQRNRLDDDEAETLAERLRGLMEKEQAYRDASLTLPVLADALGATPHLLSQVLNVRIGRSFYVFVNSYRAEALKASLLDPARAERGVLDLALEAGFNSKSTLNAFFKKHTGLTPTEFRRRAHGLGRARDHADRSAKDTA